MNCARCSNPIPAARLAAVPGTHLCMPCRAESDATPLTAYSSRLRGALVEQAALTGEQERAVERMTA